MKLMRTPRFVDVDITGRCNLRCSYCYHFSGPGTGVKAYLQYFKRPATTTQFSAPLRGITQ